MGLNYNTTTLAVNSQGYIFAGTQMGVYLSTNNGETWVFKEMNNNRSSKIAINSLGHIFLADSTGIYLPQIMAITG
jgi:hypothetical protein